VRSTSGIEPLKLKITILAGLAPFLSEDLFELKSTPFYPIAEDIVSKEAIQDLIIRKADAPIFTR